MWDEFISDFNPADDFYGCMIKMSFYSAMSDTILLKPSLETTFCISPCSQLPTSKYDLVNIWDIKISKRCKTKIEPVNK